MQEALIYNTDVKLYFVLVSSPIALHFIRLLFFYSVQMNSQPINLSYVKLSTNLTGDGDIHHVVHFPWL